MIVKLLTEHHLEFLSLKGGCTGSSESTLVKMSNCWKSHAAAHTLTSNMQRTENATPTLIEILNKLDKKLETSLTNIEGQLSNQNKRWQIIEQQLSSQNSRMNNIEQQMSQMNSWKQALSNTQNDVTRLNTEVFTVKAKMDSVKGKIETYDNSIQTYSDI